MPQLSHELGAVELSVAPISLAGRVRQKIRNVCGLLGQPPYRRLHAAARGVERRESFVLEQLLSWRGLFG